MKINKHYYLDRFYYPSSYPHPKIMRKGLKIKSATQEKIDECTIWHKGDRMPFVFYNKSVRGYYRHNYKTFYRAVCWAVKNHKTTKYRVTCGWGLKCMLDGGYRWGCRNFTLKDLKEIKGAMEFHWPELKE